MDEGSDSGGEDLVDRGLCIVWCGATSPHTDVAEMCAQTPVNCAGHAPTHVTEHV
jgi:hypothetical protein